MGKEVLAVENLSKTVQDGVTLFENLNFRVGREDKIAIVSRKRNGSYRPVQDPHRGRWSRTSGSFKWGISTSQSYFPKDNTAFFRRLRPQPHRVAAAVFHR